MSNQPPKLPGAFYASKTGGSYARDAALIASVPVFLPAHGDIFGLRVVSRSSNPANFFMVDRCPFTTVFTVILGNVLGVRSSEKPVALLDSLGRVLRRLALSGHDRKACASNLAAFLLCVRTEFAVLNKVCVFFRQGCFCFRVPFFGRSLPLHPPRHIEDTHEPHQAS